MKSRISKVENKLEAFHKFHEEVIPIENPIEKILLNWLSYLEGFDPLQVTHCQVGIGDRGLEEEGGEEWCHGEQLP